MTTTGSLPVVGHSPRQPEEAHQNPKFTAQGAAPVVDSNSDASIWRDTSLRFLGYADEIGEFVAPYFGGLGKFVGYFIASGYCLADLGTTIPRKILNAPADTSTGHKAKSAAAETADLSVFHLIATLLVPPQLIGIVTHSVEHALDQHLFDEAKAAMDKKTAEVQASGSVRKKAMHGLSQLKFKVEEGLHNLLGPTMNKILDHQEKSTGLMAGAHRQANNLLKHLGPKVAHFVRGNAYLAEKYNGFMRLEAFKDTEMPASLRKNADFLSKGGQLSQREVAKRLLMKPWPVLAGVGMIPLIAHPFDKFTVKVMDWTIRPLMGKNKIVRGEDGKLKSVHNPTFWGSAKNAPAGQGQPGPVAPQSIATPGQQPWPYLEFGAVYPPFRPGLPPQPGAPAFFANGAYSAPLGGMPALPASPAITRPRPVMAPPSGFRSVYGPGL